MTSVEVKELVERLGAAYEKVAVYPEYRMRPGAVQELGEGFMDLLALRNLAPKAASALSLLAQEREELRGALRAINELPAECVNSLICQRQIDADGTEVGVSRQAVDEIHAALVAARAALKDT
jgi:hypothetical protein